MEVIKLSPPDFGLDVSINISNNSYDEILKSNEDFEKEIQKTLDTKKPILALHSGTSALHLALILSGVVINDYVLCQSFTFIACANAIKYQGAHPIFIDSELDTGNICPTQLKAALIELSIKGITPKVLILVHLYGNPAKMLEIQKICTDFNIKIIEDAAEALGSSYDNMMCGTIGDFGVLSFNYNKIVTAAGGGALICPDNETRLKALFYASQAKENSPYYQHKEIGFNYRISHIQSILGIIQLRRLEKLKQKRLKNYIFYKNLLVPISEVNLINFESDYAISNRWLNIITLDDRHNQSITTMTLFSAFAKAGIESRPLWKPMHLQPVFKSSLYYGGKISEGLYERGLCLPSGSNLTDEDRSRIEYVIFNLFK